MTNEITRKCSRCKEEKPIVNFSIDRTRAHGRGYRCKNCKILYERQRRIDSKEIYLKKDTNYYQRNRLKILEKRKEWYLNNKNKADAQEKAKQARYKGILIKRPCEVCGIEEVHAHHDDYSKPLDVRWLCSKHHMLLHHGK